MSGPINTIFDTAARCRRQSKRCLPGSRQCRNTWLSPSAAGLARAAARTPIRQSCWRARSPDRIWLIVPSAHRIFLVRRAAVGFAWYYVVSIVGIALLAMLAFQAADIYQVQAFRGHEKQYMRLASAWSVVFLVAIGVSFFAKVGDQFSRAWLGSVLCPRAGHADRFPARAVSAGAPMDAARAASTGARSWSARSNGEALLGSLAAQRDSDLRVIGVFDDRADERSPASAGVPKLGTVDDLVEFARQTRVDLVIFSLPISAEARILQMLKKLWVLPVDIRLSAHTNKLRFRPRSYSYIGGVPVLDVFDRPIADWDVVIKWLFDKIVGSLALIVASRRSCCWSRSPSNSTARARCSSSSGATASTTS